MLTHKNKITLQCNTLNSILIQSQNIVRMRYILKHATRDAMTHHNLEWLVPETQHGMRLDRAMAEAFPDYSRALFKQCIQQGFVTIDQKVVKEAKFKLTTHQQIDCQLPTQTHQNTWEAQPGPLSILHEDEDLLVLNKPAQLTMHPGAGQPDHTLLNYLLHYHPPLTHVPRAGIVHRLDKNTTGICVVAKTEISYFKLTQQLKDRHIQRSYEAIIHGCLHFPETIDAPIGRHPKKRTMMAVHASQAKPAVTHFKPIQTFSHHTHIALKLETGRTHQIRVHMNHRHHPIVGDPTYGQQHRRYKTLSEALQKNLLSFPRQCLHATQLQLEHPSTHEVLQWQCPLADDFAALLNQLRSSEHV